MYDVNQLSMVCNIVDENPSKPMYNYFTSVHGASENGSLLDTSRMNGDISNHLDFAPSLEYNGYIPVVHEPYYIDMGNEVHFNPAPVFVPEVGITFSLVLMMLFVGLCREMR